MLSDLITAFSAPVAPAHRALGYLDEALDMRRRSRTHRASWQPHLDRSREFITATAKKCVARNQVVILGSGLLLDVPLTSLASMFRSVILKDVICLPEIRRTLREYANVTFIEQDVTDLAARLYAGGRRDVRELPEVHLPGQSDERQADLVVSLNILSQLWVVPRAFVGRRLRGIEPELADDWCGRIVENHYRWLRSLPCEVCLVADYEAVKRDGRERIVSRASTIHGLSLPHPDASWTWHIAPIGKYNPYTSKELTVGAWRFPAAS